MLLKKFGMNCLNELAVSVSSLTKKLKFFLFAVKAYPTNGFRLMSVSSLVPTLVTVLGVMSTPLGRPPSVTLGSLSFQEKVFILSLPNLIWVFNGLIACMGLLLVKIAV